MAITRRHGFGAGTWSTLDMIMELSNPATW